MAFQGLHRGHGVATEKSFSFSWKDLSRAYWYLLGDAKWKWSVFMLALFVLSFYAVVPAFLVGKIVDFFLSYQDGDRLTPFYTYTALLGASFVAVSFLRLSIKIVLGDLQSNVRYRTKVKGFEKLLDFTLAWHLEESAGGKAQRITNGVEAYRTLHGYLTNEIMTSIGSVVGMVAVFLFLQPKYVIFFILYIVGFIATLVFFRKRIQRENDLYFLSLEKAGGSYVESLSNILTIKTLGAGADFSRHIATKEELTKEHEYVIRRLSNNMWKTFQSFNGLCYGTFLFLVGQDVVQHTISPGSLVIFYGYLQTLVGNLADFMNTYEALLSAKSGIGRMMGVFWAKPAASAGTETLPTDWKDLSITDATFRYRNTGDASGERDGSHALVNLSLSIPRNAKVGIVGKTGSGKSTLAKIFAGLYELSSGSYAIGHMPFARLSHEEQTKQITLVLQETEVFNFSLRENITLFREVNPDVLTKALSISQLDEVVAKLPQGLDTLVGEKGYHLSGGERQRMGIARALCRYSPILIFDEATSSLDSKTEAMIQQGLEAYLRDKTIITIAHRVSTLEHTDIIYVFDDGKIVEQGTYAELSGNPSSKFSELYRNQRVSSVSSETSD